MSHALPTEINDSLARQLNTIAWKYTKRSACLEVDDVLQTLRLGALRALGRVDATRSDAEKRQFVVRSAEFYLMSEIDVLGGVRCPSGVRGLRNAARRKLRSNLHLTEEETAKLGALLFIHGATSETVTLESGSSIWGAHSSEADSELQLKLWLRNLSPEHAEAIALVYAEEWSYEEAAARLGTNKTTLRSQLQAAKRELKRELEGDFGRSEPLAHVRVETGKPVSQSP
jgi:RNA polymerase sigma factor (sigma-70 family)